MKKLTPALIILFVSSCANIAPSSQYVSESSAGSNLECKKIPRHKHMVKWCRPHSSK